MLQKSTDMGLVTINEAANFLSVSRSTIYKMIDEGDLTPIKVKGLNRFILQDLEEYVKKLKEKVVPAGDSVAQ